MQCSWKKLHLRQLVPSSWSRLYFPLGCNKIVRRTPCLSNIKWSIRILLAFPMHLFVHGWWGKLLNMPPTFSAYHPTYWSPGGNANYRVVIAATFNPFWKHHMTHSGRYAVRTSMHCISIHITMQSDSSYHLLHSATAAEPQNNPVCFCSALFFFLTW